MAGDRLDAKALFLVAAASLGTGFLYVILQVCTTKIYKYMELWGSDKVVKNGFLIVKREEMMCIA